ncbi:44445_t:CDS:2 [Gigaspora margarita]|uniref:44445_t:CDS:1 n=1 Tax=Gigaspora margarita TaxID=4874 RepID=A0ABN7VL61_GIGMA|nr:44445_t:CDS:2 [Gigaspora margarita]
MDRAKKVVNEKHERILLELTKQPGNDSCADCGVKGPRWASHSLGIFLCIRCGGLHRKMGTHISKVKSISLDSWTPEQIENMRQWGNLKANAKWNPRPELHPMPFNTSDSEMEKYIRNKYEKKSFCNNPSKVARKTIDSSLKHVDRGINDALLRQLKDMGFTDTTKNREVLSTTNGDLNSAIEILCRLSIGNSTSNELARSSASSNTSNDDKLVQLWNMGFHDEAKNRDALRRTGGNIELAAALLVESRTSATTNNTNSITKSQSEQRKLQLTQSQSLIDSTPSPQISTQSQNLVDLSDGFSQPAQGPGGTNMQNSAYFTTLGTGFTPQNQVSQFESQPPNAFRTNMATINSHGFGGVQNSTMNTLNKKI